MTAPEQARLGVEILATYARVRWLLRRQSLPDSVAALRGARGARQAPRTGAGQIDADSAWVYAHAVVRVLRLLPTDSRCLVRSLVLLSVLARRGVKTALVVGVLPDPEFAAHAWIERDGVPLLKPEAAGEGRLVEL